MRIREENRNMILLATVALFSAAIAGGAALLQPSATSGAERKPVYLADQTSVRLVGAPFVPNTNSRQR
jgi:hypothetical protein